MNPLAENGRGPDWVGKSWPLSLVSEVAPHQARVIISAPVPLRVGKLWLHSESFIEFRHFGTQVPEIIGFDFRKGHYILGDQ